MHSTCSICIRDTAEATSTSRRQPFRSRLTTTTERALERGQYDSCTARRRSFCIITLTWRRRYRCTVLHLPVEKCARRQSFGSRSAAVTSHLLQVIRTSRQRCRQCMQPSVKAHLRWSTSILHMRYLSTNNAINATEVSYRFPRFNNIRWSVGQYINFSPLISDCHIVTAV